MIVVPSVEMLLSLMVGIVIGKIPALELDNFYTGIFLVGLGTSCTFTLMLLLCLGSDVLYIG